MAKKAAKTEKLKCGIVMPISAIDGCSEQHWLEVLDIIKSAVTDANLDAELVSEGDESGVIPKRIVRNLFENPIVVCDISGKNPNVMLELGLRLAFDKPVIIVSDDQTKVPFDINQIEYIPYPRSLRSQSIIAFKRKLASKITATLRAAASDKNYTTFLKHYGNFKIAKLEEREFDMGYIIEQLDGLRVAVNSGLQATPRFPRSIESLGHTEFVWLIRDTDVETVRHISRTIGACWFAVSSMVRELEGSFELKVVAPIDRMHQCQTEVEKVLRDCNLEYALIPFE